MKPEITRAHPMNRNTYTAANRAKVNSSSGAETDCEMALFVSRLTPSGPDVEG